ncbi:unnamed protein product, partial [Ectocarpus sp. 8 AP-2014]
TWSDPHPPASTTHKTRTGARDQRGHKSFWRHHMFRLLGTVARGSTASGFRNSPRPGI